MNERRRLNFNRIFVPTREIGAETASLFAGRKRLLAQVVRALDRDGGSVALYGDRGVGKSSLARMVMGLIRNQIMPGELGLATNLPIPEATCVWQTWSTGMNSIPDLLLEILDPDQTGDQSFSSQLPEIAESISQEYEEITKALYQVSTNRSPTVLEAQQHRVYGLFRKVEREVRKRYERDPHKRRMIFFIDEVERMNQSQTTAGLGSLIKESPFSFVVVGIGQAFSDILHDHVSVGRKFKGGQFEVTTLDQSEVRELFDKATAAASTQGLRLEFTDEYCQRVYEDSSGYPYQIQVIGYETVEHFRAELEKGARVEIGEAEYLRVLELREQSVDRDKISSDRIEEAVGTSNQRWEILKTVVDRRKAHPEKKWVDVDEIRKHAPKAAVLTLDVTLTRFVAKGVLAFDEDQKMVQIASADILSEVNRRIRIAWKPNRDV